MTSLGINQMPHLTLPAECSPPAHLSKGFIGFSFPRRGDISNGNPISHSQLVNLDYILLDLRFFNSSHVLLWFPWRKFVSRALNQVAEEDQK